MLSDTKRQVINLQNCCIWLVNLFELYDDARTCQHQMYLTSCCNVNKPGSSGFWFKFIL